MVIITIHGTAGSGKSTLGKLLAARLQIPFFDMGAIRKQYALDHGMTLAELNRLGETDPSSDHLVDEYQRELPKAHPSFVITCRVGFHFLPQSVKIYVTSDLRVAAERIFPLKRAAEHWSSVEEGYGALLEREANDKVRFMNHYGLDITDLRQYDLVIDSTNESPLGMLETVLAFLRERGVDVPPAQG